MERNNVGRMKLTIEAVDVSENELGPTETAVSVATLDHSIYDDEDPSPLGLGGVFFLYLPGNDE
jgi:hypothetical protein